MGVGQYHVLHQRGLIRPKPPKIRDQQDGVPDPVNDPAEGIRILGNDDVVPTAVPLPILLALEPIHQLLLHVLVHVRRCRPGWPSLIYDQAEGREERDIEQVGLLGVRNPGHRGPRTVGLGSVQVPEEVPLPHVLVAGVLKVGVGGRDVTPTRPVVVLDDAVGELPGEIIHIDFDRSRGILG